MSSSTTTTTNNTPGAAKTTVSTHTFQPTRSEDFTAILITAVFGGFIGLVLSILRNISQRLSIGVVESWIKSAFIGFLFGALIAAASVALWTLVINVRSHYVNASVQQATQAANADQIYTNSALSIANSQQQLNAARDAAARYAALSPAGTTQAPAA